MGAASSFPDGLEELPRALARATRPRRIVARGPPPSSRAASGGWRVATAGGCALRRRTPGRSPRLASASAALLAPARARAAAALRAVPHAPVAVACLGFRARRAADLGMDLDAYGFLVARGEGVRVLGCQYESSIFAGARPRAARSCACSWAGRSSRDRRRQRRRVAARRRGRPAPGGRPAPRARLRRRLVGALGFRNMTADSGSGFKRSTPPSPPSPACTSSDSGPWRGRERHRRRREARPRPRVGRAIAPSNQVRGRTSSSRLDSPRGRLDFRGMHHGGTRWAI